MLPLELLVNDAQERIRRAYNESDGKVYLSFSGGKDSTILAKLVELTGLHIPLVFANTGVELNATLDFVKNFDVVELRPKKPLVKVLREDGYPFVSKVRSKNIATWQNFVNKGIDPSTTKTGNELLGIKYKHSRNKLADKHMHVIHEDHEFKISDKCCSALKKEPFYEYEKESGFHTSLLGIRLSEGGAREQYYDKCYIERKQHLHTQKLFFPILEWSDKDCTEFIKKYDVKLSRAYTVYGFTRTGCCGCVFSQELEKTLPVLRIFEPNKYKASMSFFKDVYVAQNVILRTDDDYMKYYVEHRPKYEKRRLEVLKKYHPNKKIRKFTK